MLIQRANQYCSDPSPYQAQAMGQWVGACRWEYNDGLKRRIFDYENYGFRLGYNIQARELTRERAKRDWLDFAPVHALQYALQHLEDAFARFFSGQNEFPKPRKKYKDDSFTLPAEDVEFKRLNKNVGAIRLPKIGWVHFRGYRPLGGKLVSVTFRRKAGRWLVSCAWEQEIPDPPKSEFPTVAIDRGVAVFAAMSDGRRYKPLNAFSTIRDKLAKLQRRLARKVKFSSNWSKLKGKIARLRHHEANARRDWHHKLSTWEAKSHGLVKLEKLRVKNMTASAAGTVQEPGRNVAAKSGLNRSILDQGWGMFAGMLAYKLPFYGGELRFVAAPYTSIGCRMCGVIDAASRVSQDRFVCTACGHAEHADTHAACNIEQARTLAVEPPKRIRTRVGKRKPRDVAHAV